MTLEGKPAKAVIIRCSTCYCEMFKILGPAPPGTLHGQVLDTGTIGVTIAECTKCGEQFEFTKIAGVNKTV